MGEGKTTDERFIVKRKYKDAVFRKLFSDLTAAAELIYALCGRVILPDEEFEPITLYDTIARYYRNDLAFRAGDELFILVEHQSTHDRDLPLRMLNYATQTYLRFRDREGNRRAPLPQTKLYVIYHGKQRLPEELRLSDISAAPSDGLGENGVECRVKVVDIRRNDPTLERSRALYGYSELIKAVDSALSVGKTIEEAAKEAVQYCLDNGLLVEFLKEHAWEVIKMLEMEYNYDRDIRRHKEIAYEEGREEGIEVGIEKGREEGIEVGIEKGREEGMLKIVQTMRENGLSDEQIANLTKLSLDFIRKTGD